MRSKAHMARATGAGVVAAAVLAGVALASGCASRPGVRLDTPTEVVRAQCAALASGDELAAAALLAPEARRRAPLWPAPADVPDPHSATEVGRVAHWDAERPADRPIDLVRTADGWQIAGGVLGLSRADTPERALEAFARGILARDWDLVAGLLPSDAQPGATGRVASWLGEGKRGAHWRLLATALGEKRFRLEATRGETQAHVEGGGPDAPTVILVREPGGWKVFDVRPRTEYTAP